MSSVIIVCGVSGSGKSTIARALAERLSARFVEGDEHHPKSNVEKMASGHPLTDDDRTAWLASICKDLAIHMDKVNILACSALTPYVQSFLKERLGERICWVKLEISEETANARMNARMEAQSHFMPSSLLQSQFEAWHPPASGLTISTEQPIAHIVDGIADFLETSQNS